MQVRLQKILSQAGLCSRRKAEALIRLGKVTVNGRVTTELGSRADPQRDRITVEGKPLPRNVAPAYWAFNKPCGVITSLSDPGGRPTVKDWLRKCRIRLYPVGRLDYNSSGLVLLTNDGELASRIMHPRYKVPKVYRAKVSGVPGPTTITRLRSGVELTDGPCRPLAVEVERRLPTKTWLRITVVEGRQHLVRRVCAAVGHPVEKLSRTGVGPVKLGALRLGEIRVLGEREVTRLRRAVGLE